MFLLDFSKLVLWFNIKNKDIDDQVVYLGQGSLKRYQRDTKVELRQKWYCF